MFGSCKAHTVGHGRSLLFVLTQVDEELEGYKKSGDKYLDKVDFLKRAELRQYEQERDQRLSQDMRSRGRL